MFMSNASAGTWEDRRSKLDEAAVYDRFRIFYSLSGKDALPRKRQIDSNNNKVPDFIESVGSRLIDADSFFRQEVGLRPPLKSKRYIGHAHYIDVNVLDFSNNKNGPKNGVAYDGTPLFNRSLSGQASLNVITIDLSGSVRLKSQSIEHELFHLYQNGYTYFKNRWYTEGTARWSELVMIGRIGNGEELPKTTIQKEELFNKSYAANKFWNRLIAKVDQKTLGKKFIRLLLEQLDYADDSAAKDRGMVNKNWKESEQRSNKNNLYIWNAAIESAKRINDGQIASYDKLQALLLL